MADIINFKAEKEERKRKKKEAEDRGVIARILNRATHLTGEEYDPKTGKLKRATNCDDRDDPPPVA